MGTNYYLAVDIGASSGRHMLSHMENGKMILEEIYRFPNGMVEKNGHKVWDVDKLFEEILTGMKKCALAGKIPYSMGIDTWAVDFVLLDENGIPGQTDGRNGQEGIWHHFRGGSISENRNTETDIQYDLSADGSQRAAAGAA